MNEADLQKIVEEVMRRMLAANGGDATPLTPTPASPPADTTTTSSVVTRDDILALVTPLARDLAGEQGIKPVLANEQANDQSTPPKAQEGTTLTHLRASASLDLAFYERALHEPEQTTTRVLGELRAFIQRCWLREPADIQQLRTISRPPMGNLPCCFYANFNLFWAGENLQVCRQQVIDGGQPLTAVSSLLAGLLERHAARLEKWSMTETVALERRLVQYFRGPGPANREEFLAVVEHALIALNRVQSWIDGLIPWNDLDTHLALRRPL